MLKLTNQFVFFLSSVPEPTDLEVKSITSDSATLSYKIPSNNANITTIKAVLVNRDTGDRKEVLAPAQEPTGEIPFQGLEPGTEYFFQVKTMAIGNRNSDYESSDPFKTGEFDFILKLF